MQRRQTLWKTEHCSEKPSGKHQWIEPQKQLGAKWTEERKEQHSENEKILGKNKSRKINLRFQEEKKKTNQNIKIKLYKGYTLYLKVLM